MTRMKNNTSVFCALSVAFLALAGCDFVDGRALDRERADSVYRDAMSEYAAGRIDKAMSGLERVIAATPANSSARFQLACLLQDSKKDYLGAICHYREFLLLDSSGDKAGLAKSRIEQCERLLGPELMRRFDIGDNATLADANVKLNERIGMLEKTNADLEKRLEKAMARARESAEEADRMRQMLRGDVVESSGPKIESVAQLLDDEDEPVDRILTSKDAERLVLENEREDAVTPFAAADRAKAKESGKSVSATASSSEPPHEPRPPEYVVQDGDTLYKIAIRFYGKRSAWTRIREANKAVISTDGRIVVGQKLVLP